MSIRPRYAIPVGIVLLALSVAACGAPGPERLLKKSEQVPVLHEFGGIYVPLYQQAMVDSNWTPVRAQLRELERLKNEISALPCPENRILARREWERNQTLFARGVGFLNVALGTEDSTAEKQEDIVTGLTGVYDWWSELVRFLK